jgi:hypothetical protein
MVLQLFGAAEGVSACFTCERLYRNQVGITYGMVFFIMERKLVGFKEGFLTHRAFPLTCRIPLCTLMSASFRAPTPSIHASNPLPCATSAYFPYIFFTTCCHVFRFRFIWGSIGKSREGSARAPCIQSLFSVWVNFFWGESFLNPALPLIFILCQPEPICICNLGCP